MNINLILIVLLSVSFRLSPYFIEATESGHQVVGRKELKEVTDKDADLYKENTDLKEIEIDTTDQDSYKSVFGQRVKKLMNKFSKKPVMESNEDNNIAAKSEKTISLSRKRGKVAPTLHHTDDNVDDAQIAQVDNQKKLVNLAANDEHDARSKLQNVQESYNELFLNLAERYNLQKNLMNNRKNGGKITALNYKRKEKATLLSPRQMAQAYFQSNAYQNNPSRENNPLRAQRLNLLKDDDFLEKHGKLSQFLIVKNMNSIKDKPESIEAKKSSKKMKSKIELMDDDFTRDQNLESPSEERKNGFKNRFVHMIDENKRRRDPISEIKKKRKHKQHNIEETNEENNENLLFIPKETVEKHLAESRQNNITSNEASTETIEKSEEGAVAQENTENISELKESNENENTELLSKNDQENESNENVSELSMTHKKDNNRNNYFNSNEESHQLKNNKKLNYLSDQINNNNNYDNYEGYDYYQKQRNFGYRPLAFNNYQQIDNIRYKNRFNPFQNTRLFYFNNNPNTYQDHFENGYRYGLQQQQQQQLQHENYEPNQMEFESDNLRERFPQLEGDLLNEEQVENIVVDTGKTNEIRDKKHGSGIKRLNFKRKQKDDNSDILLIDKDY